MPAPLIIQPPRTRTIVVRAPPQHFAVPTTTSTTQRTSTPLTIVYKPPPKSTNGPQVQVSNTFVYILQLQLIIQTFYMSIKSSLRFVMLLHHVHSTFFPDSYILHARRAQSTRVQVHQLSIRKHRSCSDERSRAEMRSVALRPRARTVSDIICCRMSTRNSQALRYASTRAHCA